jgi:hypothetical protein
MRTTTMVMTTPVQIRIVSRLVACRVVGLTWVSYAACIPLLSTKYVSLELALRGNYIRPSDLCKILRLIM